MHEFNADANKVDIHSNNTPKQPSFKMYTKEKSLILYPVGGAWASYRVAHSLSFLIRVPGLQRLFASVVKNIL